MFPVNAYDITKTQTNTVGAIEQEGTPGVLFGEKVTGSGAREPHGMRKYLYVQNGSSTAFTAGHLLRQICINDFATEGTMLTADANTTGAKYIDDATSGAEADEMGVTNHWGYKFWSTTAAGAAARTGNIVDNTVDRFDLITAQTTAITDTDTYGIYKPFAMTQCAADAQTVVCGIAVSAIPALGWGWMQVYGFGYIMIDDSTSSVATEFGEGLIIGSTNGCATGRVAAAGTEVMPQFGFTLVTSTLTTAAHLHPCFINTMMSF
jgi:hypothetical protein